jgi:hypothetical protein
VQQLPALRPVLRKTEIDSVAFGLVPSRCNNFLVRNAESRFVRQFLRDGHTDAVGGHQWESQALLQNGQDRNTRENVLEMSALGQLRIESVISDP